MSTVHAQPLTGRTRLAKVDLMSWEQRMARLFDDLEGRAEDLLGRERDWEVAEQARAEYASVLLASRMMASTGHDVVLQVLGAGRLAGRLVRCAETWCLLEDQGREWVVSLPAVLTVAGASERALPREAWPVTARLSLTSALCRSADADEQVMLALVDGSRLQGRWGRSGSDFAELRRRSDEPPVLVPHPAIAAFGHLPSPW